MAAACSPDCRYYAAISDDGRLRIWSTDTNALLQEYTPDLHLSAPPVCLAWITLGIGTATKKARKRKSSLSEPPPEQPQSNFIALGTTFGKIILYSVAQAKVENVLEPTIKFKQSTVTCIDWSKEYGLFSGSSNNYLYEWDVTNSVLKNKYDCSFEVKNKNTDKISAIKIIPSSLDQNSRLAVTASNRIRLWSLSPLKLLRTMIGHSAPVSIIALAKFNSKYLIGTCSKTERLLSFWDATVSVEETSLTQNGDSHKHKTDSPIVSPAYNFITEDSIASFDLRSEDDKIHLSVVTKGGALHYYGPTLNGVSVKPLKPSVTMHVSTEDATPLPIVCCRLTGVTDGQVLVGYRSGPVRYCFERITPSFKNKTQVLIRAISDSEEKKTSSQTKEKPAAAPVVFAQPAAAVKRTANYTSKDEVPMESRLANLELGETREGSVNQNLTKLLLQGLHSNDRELVMTVLQKTDPKTAARTVSKLPSKYVPALLEQLANMAGGRTHLCKAVCTWLTALLRCHSALLLATLGTPDMSDKLSRLLAVLAQRRSNLSQLLNLKGRLELMSAQRCRVDNLDNETEPYIDYNDASDVESDLEMELCEDGSEEEDASLRDGSSEDENQ